MKYFAELPIIATSLSEENGEYTIRNMFIKLKFQDFNLTANANLLEDYIILEGETPELVAYKLYGSTDYWWIVCFIAGVKDTFYDWPLKQEEVKMYHEEITKEYPNNSKYNLNTLIEENEAKRIIKILKPVYLNELIANYLTEKNINNIVL